MADDRAMAAAERIERALARMEAAAANTTGETGAEAELALLREKHAALRQKVGAAIGQIDELLNAHGAS